MRTIKDGRRGVLSIERVWILLLLSSVRPNGRDTDLQVTVEHQMQVSEGLLDACSRVHEALLVSATTGQGAGAT